jgi:hypothetical protein
MFLTTKETIKATKEDAKTAIKISTNITTTPPYLSIIFKNKLIFFQCAGILLKNSQVKPVTG